MVGLGTWQAAPGEVGAAVRTALEAGYRHIDCAACYGNEKEIGDVLVEMVGDGEGQIPRSEVFITSKLWNSEHAPAHVQPALDQTLADLARHLHRRWHHRLHHLHLLPHGPPRPHQHRLAHTAA